jgi:RimJ/RimL family protein N-acetyltransferase
MLQELTLRLLEPSDEPALAALFEANNVPEVIRWFDPFPLGSDTARTLSRGKGLDLYWGVWSRADLVAFSMVRGWEDRHPHPAYGCLVDRRQQGRGIGGTSTVLALEDLRERSVPEVRARIHDDNVASLRMLVRAGFEELERGAGRILLAAHPHSPRVADRVRVG